MIGLGGGFVFFDFHVFVPLVLPHLLQLLDVGGDGGEEDGSGSFVGKWFWLGASR